MSTFVKFGCAAAATAMLCQGCSKELPKNYMPTSSDHITNSTWFYVSNDSATGVAVKFECIGVKEYSSYWYVCDNSAFVNDYNENNPLPTVQLTGALNCSFPGAFGPTFFKNAVGSSGSGSFFVSPDLVYTEKPSRDEATDETLGSTFPKLQNPATDWSADHFDMGPVAHYIGTHPYDDRSMRMYYDRTQQKVIIEADPQY